jgi:membrane protease subunit (stomatin/prohibitin family)
MSKSLFVTIRDFVQAPMTSFVAFDPILNKLKTGKFNLSVSSYKQRVAAGVHELYSQDRLAQKIGIKESSVVKVAVIAGYVVAAYFTCGAASGVFGGGSGTAGGVSAGDVYQGVSAAEALNKANQQKKAAADQQAAQAAAQAQAAEAEKQAAIAAGLNQKSATVSPAAILTILAAAAALLS